MIRKNPAVFLLAAAHLLPCRPVWAAAGEPTLPIVLVEDGGDGAAAAEPAYSRLALPESVEAVQTLTREDIEKIRPRDVYDLIENAPGMSIMRQGARVHNFAFSRGDDVGIILDGVYLTQTEARRVLGDLQPELIESIRFVRDSTVLTIAPLTGFGSASAGAPNQGFILISTRRSVPDGRHAELRGSYATYDTWKVSGFASQSWLDGRARIGAGYQHTASEGKSDWHNGYNGNSFLVNGGYRDQRFEAAASLYVNRASRDIQRAMGTYTGRTGYPVSGPTPNGVLDKNVWEYDPMDTEVFSASLAHHWNAAHTTALLYGWTEAEGTRYPYTTLSDRSRVAGTEARDWAQEWNLSHTIEWGANTLKVGAQSLNWYQLTEGQETARREKLYGYYVTDEYRIAPDWTLDLALRTDRKKIVKGGEKYLSSGREVRLDDGDWSDDAFAVSVGAAWQIDAVFRVSARYSYNRTPTPDVLTTIDDASLADEVRSRYELGLEADVSRAFKATLTPFYYDIQDAKVSAGTLTEDANGDPIIDPSTGEETSITLYDAANRIRKGLELSLSGRLANDALGYELGWTTFTDNAEDGEHGTEFPDNKYSARLNWRQGPWDSTLSLLKVDPYLSYGYTVGDFTTVNLSVARRFDRGITLTVYGQNLTDEQYGTNNKGYPARANWGVLRDVGATYGVEVAVVF
ncbi:TonB-dependent receptor [Imhoffiella purpurea]|uniref:Outer membrane receptor for ferric coprogen and ferric-rhodotorulic acid n=1 Tax=Imhoffiella purpurea TaxID=1249627 RepID=W9VZP8_9GAMM|nr:TonB-dependent receptor [Imhoffiella purpurea]EXJ15815.1 Outer membrane receptor for ferric coprogen and ferric-rhodotorulic acid [Imhoffiella purpurea]